MSPPLKRASDGWSQKRYQYPASAIAKIHVMSLPDCLCVNSTSAYNEEIFSMKDVKISLHVFHIHEEGNCNLLQIYGV